MHLYQPIKNIYFNITFAFKFLETVTKIINMSLNIINY